MRFSCISVLSGAVAMVAAGCADLALEPDQIPASMVITPADTLITEGDPAKLTVTVLDEDGERIPGPPSWAPPEWIPNDPSKIDIAPDGSLIGLGGADLRVTAKLAGLEGWTTLRINPGSIVLTAPAIHINQVIQNREGSVPIIAGRPGLLRVFATGDELSFYQPRVRATFLQEGQAVLTGEMASFSDVLAGEVQEGRLDRSFNMEIPGRVFQPGVELVVELDVDNVVPMESGSQPRIPAEGAMKLDVVSMPRLDQTIVPVLLSSSPDEQVFNWTRGLTHESKQMQLARTLLPVGEMKVRVHEPYYSSSDLTTEGGWNRFIREIRTVWLMEGEVGYYYGAVQAGPGFAYGGLGYLDTPVSVGVTSESTYAHELGHNMTLLHAPCGSAGGPDPNFPYDDGSSGQWGYNLARSRLVDPEQYRDLMGYCRPDWVSDYHFMKAMNHRLTGEGTGAPDPGAPQRTLMLWGGNDNGELVLEPAFMIDGPPRLPAEEGPYRLEGFGPVGELHFSFSFTPTPVEFGGGHFQFAIPYDPELDGALERVVLSGPEGQFTLGRSSTPPMAIIRSRTSGQVRAILRDWSGGLSRIEGNVEILVSNGLPGGGR